MLTCLAAANEAPASRRSPVATPSTDNFPADRVASAWMTGNSVRHGPHQDAQKLITAGPRISVSATFAPPVKQGSRRSGRSVGPALGGAVRVVQSANGEGVSSSLLLEHAAVPRASSSTAGTVRHGQNRDQRDRHREPAGTRALTGPPAPARPRSAPARGRPRRRPPARGPADP